MSYERQQTLSDLDDLTILIHSLEKELQLLYANRTLDVLLDNPTNNQGIFEMETRLKKAKECKKGLLSEFDGSYCASRVLGQLR